MIQLYGRTPFDLFRYGLKVDARPLRFLTTLTGKYININMTQDLALGLSILISHPIWHNDIALLRFALQYAVYCRIEDHIQPLPAVLDAMANDTQDEFLQSIIKVQNNKELPEKQWRQLLGDYYYHSLDHGGPHANLDLKELFAELKKRVKPRPATNDQEKMLFLLRLSDVRAIGDSLDSLEVYGQKKWASVDTYYRQRMDVLRKVTRFLPPSSSTLQQWKKACFLHELREKIIRHKIRLAGQPDNLLDYPEVDPIPFYLLSKHVNTSQRAVIRGVIYSVDEEQLPPPSEKNDSAAH